jgi:putative oxidoreductase
MRCSNKRRFIHQLRSDERIQMTGSPGVPYSEPVRSPRRPRGPRRVERLVWTVRIALAAIFIGVAIPKLADLHSSATMFADIGAGRCLQYFVGSAELAGAIGLLISPLAALAAAGMAADMLGATIINIVVLHSPAFGITVSLCIVLVLLARNRWQQHTTAGGLRALRRLPPNSSVKIDSMMPPETERRLRYSAERLGTLLATLSSSGTAPPRPVDDQTESGSTRRLDFHVINARRMQ